MGMTGKGMLEEALKSYATANQPIASHTSISALKKP
jgi:hypothetical protein